LRAKELPRDGSGGDGEIKETYVNEHVPLYWRRVCGDENQKKNNIPGQLEKERDGKSEKGGKTGLLGRNRGNTEGGQTQNPPHNPRVSEGNAFVSLRDE